MFVVKMTKKNPEKEANKKLINLPLELWNILEQDAERCRRSVTKQMEAILTTYYEKGSVELNPIGIQNSRQANNFSAQEINELVGEESRFGEDFNSEGLSQEEYKQQQLNLREQTKTYKDNFSKRKIS